MVRRLLPLLLALCTLVPADVLARWIEACHAPDRCACRKDDDRGPQGAFVERVDCCDAPCDARALATPAIRTTSSQLAFGPAGGFELVATIAPRPEAFRAPPPARTRGPPTRVHALVGHWLV